MTNVGGTTLAPEKYLQPISLTLFGSFTPEMAGY